MAAKLTLLEDEWTRQPPPGTKINWKNPITRGLYDAWLPQTLPFSSVLGRRPIVSAPITLSTCVRGISASAISGSIRYDIGGLFQSAPHAFLFVAEIRSVGSTASIIRQDGAFSPAQISNSNFRSVVWSPIDTGRYFYGYAPPQPFSDVFIANRLSTSTFELWRASAGLVSSTSSLSGYGSTANPLCFLGNESNGELATASVAGFIGGVAFGRGLSVSEILSLLANPWQIFEPEEIPLFKPVVTAQYARPTSDVSAGTWTASTGSDLYAMLDETSANDSDYITTTSASTCEVALDSLTDPAVSTGHIVRYRISATGGGIIVRLREGSTTIASWTHNPAPGSLTTYAQTLSGGEADSITSYAALKLQFEAIA